MMAQTKHPLAGRKQSAAHIQQRMSWAGTPEGKGKIRAAMRRRWGDPTERFWSKVDRSGECWLWQGSSDQHGYGSYYWGGRGQKAHRVAWQIANGEIANGAMVLHRCDNPRCVNPEHLFLGSQADNMRDKQQKGRAVGGPGAKIGEKHHMAKLTEEKVRDARTRFAAGERLTHLAKEFGVSPGTLSFAVRGKTWPSA